MEENNDLISLENRHRKEKKETQAQIQELKKLAKNDKNKKKHLTTEIARLETELDNRHKEELLIFTESKVETVPELINDNCSKIKISKAQKRRDRKSQLEKERNDEIKLQEKENINGPRNMEIQAINTKLKGKHLSIYHIPSDGDCLYRAVSHQLATVRQLTHSVKELRHICATYIRQNNEDFMPFMSNQDTSEMLTEDEFVKYCDNVENTKVWGGQLEIRSLSNSLKCPIHVIQATGPDCIEQGTEFNGHPLIITYHRHMYSLGEHYNSTQSFSETDESSNFYNPKI